LVGHFGLLSLVFKDFRKDTPTYHFFNLQKECYTYEGSRVGIFFRLTGLKQDR
jgi:hypothetical protein